LDCQKLEAAVNEYGSKWLKISQIMGRSAVACMRKSKKMFLALPQDRNFWTDEETQ
jgi:hypothetical protein